MSVGRKALSTVCLLAFALAASTAAFSLVAAEHATAPTNPSALFKPARPYWIELPQAQRQALAPLADDWERLDLQTKKKWVEIANRYPRMSPDEQGRTQQRMREWARLTPDQRRVARDSFARIRSMNPEQRADLLRKYQELPDDKKQALTTQGQANKGIVVSRTPPVAASRRVEIREGAKVRNPAVAAQKNANPIVAPAVRAPKAPEVAPPAAATVATEPVAAPKAATAP